jgi:ParB family chromosome partitioning protein
MAKPATTKKSIFIPGAFDDLRAAATGDTGTGPLRIRLVDIDEDPEQPRTTFDQGELEQLAETITLLGGVLQPIGLRAPVDGRYMLVFGARRYRASRLLGLPDIPAIIVAGEQAGLAAQVIENQSRANLSNSDLAAVVRRLGADGMKGKQIGTVCGLTDYAVTMFRSVGKLPPFLSKQLDEGDMRAIYELFTAWQKQPAEIEAAMVGHDAALSVTEARRIIESATGRNTGSIFLKPKAGPGGEQEVQAEPQPEPQPVLAAPDLAIVPAAPSQEEDAGPSSPSLVDLPLPPAPEVEPAPLISRPSVKPSPVLVASTPKAHSAPVFVVEVDGEQGELMTELRSDKADFAFVQIGTARVEVPFAELRCIGVR